MAITSATKAITSAVMSTYIYMAISSAIMAITSAKQVVIPSATKIKQKQNISCLKLVFQLLHGNYISQIGVIPSATVVLTSTTIIM